MSKREHSDTVDDVSTLTHESKHTDLVPSSSIDDTHPTIEMQHDPSHWPWRDEHDVRPRPTALFDSLCADPLSMLHRSFTPFDIAGIVRERVNGPKWLHVGNTRNSVLWKSAVLEFDLGGADQAWVARAPLAVPIYFHVATLSAAGLPLVIGGYRDDCPSRAVSEFAPRRNLWCSVAALPEDRHGHTATTIGGDVFVCGGGTSSGPFSSDVQVLRDVALAWAPATPMSSSLVGHACAALADAASPGFVVASGSTPGFRESAQSHRYDCASDQWTRLGDLFEARRGHHAETLGDGAVYVCGGWQSAITERLDVRAATWQVVTPLPAAVSYHAVSLFDATTMVSLGGNVNGTISSRCFAYDTRADRWWKEPRWELPNPCHYHTVTRF